MKGQVSMEYLAVYGFAIAVILGTLATFVYLSGDPQSKIPSDCKFSPEIECRDHEVVSNGQTTLLIRNKDTKLYEVSLICDFSGTETKSVMIPFVDLGEEFTISCDTPSKVKADEEVKIDVSLEYNLNLTQMKNFRYFHGTVLAKAK